MSYAESFEYLGYGSMLDDVSRTGASSWACREAALIVAEASASCISRLITTPKRAITCFTGCVMGPVKILWFLYINHTLSEVVSLGNANCNLALQ